MKKIYALLVIAICLAGIPNTWAQLEDNRAVQLTRSAIQAERKAILAANIQLDEKESAIFWPLYQEYRNALETAISTRRMIESVFTTLFSEHHCHQCPSHRHH